MIKYSKWCIVSLLWSRAGMCLPASDVWEQSLCGRRTAVSHLKSYQAILRSVPNCPWKGIAIFHLTIGSVGEFWSSSEKKDPANTNIPSLQRATSPQDESVCRVVVGTLFHPMLHYAHLMYTVDLNWSRKKLSGLQTIQGSKCFFKYNLNSMLNLTSSIIHC